MGCTQVYMHINTLFLSLAPSLYCSLSSPWPCCLTVAWPLGQWIRRSGSGTWAAGPVTGCWRDIQGKERAMYVYIVHPSRNILSLKGFLSLIYNLLPVLSLATALYCRLCCPEPCCLTVAWPPGQGIKRSGSGTWAAGSVTGCWRDIQR